MEVSVIRAEWMPVPETTLIELIDGIRFGSEDKHRFYCMVLHCLRNTQQDATFWADNIQPLFYGSGTRTWAYC